VVYLTSKLNWETYKQIPEKLRKEFDYKFGEAPKLSVGAITNTLVFTLLIIIVFMSSTLLILQVDEFEEYKDSLFEIFKSVDLLIIGTIIFFIIVIVLDLIFYGAWFYNKRKWLKLHEIKIQYPLIKKIKEFKLGKR